MFLLQVHNQRIERLWRDVFANVVINFYHAFHTLEDDHILDPNNDAHISCLHSIFLPLLNKQLNAWANGWNHHKIRTARNQSPQQLWNSKRIAGDDDEVSESQISFTYSSLTLA